MMSQRWCAQVVSLLSRRRGTRVRRRPLLLEVLEGRCLLSFLPAVNYAAGSYPISVAVGDFNGDGTADLAVANFTNAGTVSVLLGNGDGSFQAPVSYAVDFNPLAVVVGDVNGDGILDLATANEFGNNVSVLLGNGDGTFQNAVKYPVNGHPYALTVGDFTGTGIADLAATTTYDGGAVSVLLGNGDGTFQNAKDNITGPSPVAVAVGDVNGDGTNDIVTANHSNPSHTASVLLGNGDGTFMPYVNFGIGANGDGVALGDLADSGHLDIVTSNCACGNSGAFSSVSVLLGYGNGSFHGAVDYAVGSHPYAAALGDVTGDGVPDIATANYGGNSVSVLLGRGDGTFESRTDYAVGSHPESVAVGDFNGDGFPDLVTANYSAGTVSVLLNDGNWPAAPPTTAASSRPPALPEALRAPGTGIGRTGDDGPTLTVWPQASERLPDRLGSQPPGEPACVLPVGAASSADHPRVFRLSRRDSTHSVVGGADPPRNAELANNSPNASSSPSAASF